MLETAEPQVQSAGAAPQLGSETAGGGMGGAGGETTFSSAGPLPPVAAGGAAGAPPPPTASEQAFGGGAGGAAGDAGGDAGMPSVQRVGLEPDETPAPNGDAGLDRDLEAPRRQLASHGQAMPQKGGAEELAGNPHVVPAHAGSAPKDGPPPSPEIAAAVQQAQNDAKAGTDEAKSEAEAYKAGMQQQRDRFDNEQHATMLEQLKVMSPADKRAMLKDFGYSAKDIRKLTDAEVDQVIEDKYDASQRKTKILGMDPDELAKLTPAQKVQFLVDIGIDKGDLDHIGEVKAAQAFDEIMKVAHVEGQHKVKIKIKGGFFKSKSWEVTVKCDGAGNTDISAEKKGGFLSKLWGWLKLALPIILTILAPLTAGVSLIVLAVYQAVTAIMTGDWLGAVIAVAGAVVGAGVFMAARGMSAAATGFTKLASVARKVKDVASAAKAALQAEKAKNPGSLLAALADGASAFASFASSAADKFAETMNSWADKLRKWEAIVNGGQTVMTAIKGHDPVAALAGALDTAAAVTGSKNGATKDLQKASTIAGYVETGRTALRSKPPDYGAVAAAALGIAGQLNKDGRIQDAAKITAKANALKNAIVGKDPGALAEAALGLAEAIQVAKYDHDHPDAAAQPGGSTENPVTERYQRANEIVQTASTVLKAARAKPRPDYIAAASAITQLTADLTANKHADDAAKLLSKFDAWTRAVNSKDEAAIFAAGTALGDAINSMRADINKEHQDAKQAAQKDGGAGAPPPASDAGDLAPDPGAAQQPLPSSPITGIDLTPGAPAPQPGGDGGTEPLPSKPLPPVDLTPGAQPGQTPTTEPGTEPAGPTIGAPDQDAEAGPTPEEKAKAERTMTVIKIFGGVADAFGQALPKAAIEEWEALAEAYEAFHKEGREKGSDYEKTVKSLVALGTSGEFIKACAEELDSYKDAFENAIAAGKGEAEAASAGFEAIGRYGRLLGALASIARAGGIPGNLADAAGNLLTVAGYKPDGRHVTLGERLKAASALATEAGALTEDLPWLAEVARSAAAKLATSESAEAAIAIVKTAARRLSADLEPVISKYLSPVLEKIASSEGAEVAKTVAGKLAGAIAQWGDTWLGRVLTSSVFKEAAAALGEHFVSILETAAGPEVQIPLLVAQLEVDMGKEMYSSAYQGLSHFLSKRLFGGYTIDEIKRELHSKPTSTYAQCDAFFSWAFYTLLQGAPEEQRLWWNQIWSVLPGKIDPVVVKGVKGSMDNFATDPVGTLSHLEPQDLKLVAASTITDITEQFLDSEYRRVFGVDP